MKRLLAACFLFFLSVPAQAQLAVARDTISVIENGRVLKMPWANGINYANCSNIDFNLDGKKDLLLFDRLNQYGQGKFRCFVNMGNSGETKYREESYYSYLFPEVANWAVCRDFNCDGKEDLFCSTSSGIKVYKNISSIGFFGFELFKPLLYSNYNPNGPASISNLYASSVGVPGIDDVDGDGKPDILTFSPQGVLIEFHKNISTNCDSLIFQLENNCWGDIAESSCAVSFSVCNQKSDDYKSNQNYKTYHAGSCLTCLDNEGDGDQDLLMGDISCNMLQFIHNSGTASTAMFTDTTKLYPGYPNKNSSLPVLMNSFPCAYLVDVNGDSKKDLIATPNTVGGENFRSVWYYNNTSSNNGVDFHFVKSNFLQDEMIDVGQNSFPVLFDYNADGKKDLLLGNYGYYENNGLKARLTLYENIGNLSQPVFSLITRDYASLSSYTLSNSLPINNVMPTVGDIDNDGDVDICIGTSSGQIHWLENTAGAGNVCVFSTFKENPFGFTTASSSAAPQLFDIDNNGVLDLLIGTKNGRIAYYRNMSTNSVPNFSLMSAFFGSVDVKGDPNKYGYDAYAVPYFFKDGSVTKLLVGSVTGQIFQYLVPSVLSSSFQLISTSVNGYLEGGQSSMCFEDINNDSKRDLFIGNAAGGLSFFSSRSPNVGINEWSNGNNRLSVTLFPNPSNNTMQLNINNDGFTTATYQLFDLSGRELGKYTMNASTVTIHLENLSPGIYFLKLEAIVNNRIQRNTYKLIKN